MAVTRLLAVVLLLAACSATVDAAPAKRLVLEPPPTRIPYQTATPYPSGGLGLWRQEWEARFGPPSRIGAVPNPRYVSYQGGQMAASYANDLVWYLEKSWPEPTSLELARAEANGFLPSDAAFEDEFFTRWARRYEIYNSATLADRFRYAAENGEAINPWLGARPGTFIVFYREVEGRVTSIGLSTGINP